MNSGLPRLSRLSTLVTTCYQVASRHMWACWPTWRAFTYSKTSSVASFQRRSEIWSTWLIFVSIAITLLDLFLRRLENYCCCRNCGCFKTNLWAKFLPRSQTLMDWVTCDSTSIRWLERYLRSCTPFTISGAWTSTTCPLTEPSAPALACSPIFRSCVSGKQIWLGPSQPNLLYLTTQQYH